MYETGIEGHLLQQGTAQMYARFTFQYKQAEKKKKNAKAYALAWDFRSHLPVAQACLVEIITLLVLGITVSITPCFSTMWTRLLQIIAW